MRYRLLGVQCRNCGEHYKEREKPCPHCGEANWTDERHQQTMDGDVYE